MDFGLVHLQGQSQPPQVPPGPNPHAERIPKDGDQNLTDAGQMLGTPAYMAPEQIQRQRPDARSDIYSLGGVATFLLTGHPPFECETLEELYAAHVSAPVPRLRERVPELPEALESVIMRCLAKDPAARYQSVGEVAAALAATAAASEWDSARAKIWWQTHAEP